MVATQRAIFTSFIGFSSFTARAGLLPFTSFTAGP